MDPRLTMDCLGEEMAGPSCARRPAQGRRDRPCLRSAMSSSGTQGTPTRRSDSTSWSVSRCSNLAGYRKRPNYSTRSHPRNGSARRALRTSSGPTWTWFAGISSRRTSSGAPNPASAEAGRWSLTEAHNHAALRAELALWMGNPALAFDEVLTMLRALEGTDGPGRPAICSRSASAPAPTWRKRAIPTRPVPPSTSWPAYVAEPGPTRSRGRCPRRPPRPVCCGRRNSPVSVAARIQIRGSTPPRPGTH